MNVTNIFQTFVGRGSFLKVMMMSFVKINFKLCVNHECLFLHLCVDWSMHF